MVANSITLKQIAREEAPKANVLVKPGLFSNAVDGYEVDLVTEYETYTIFVKYELLNPEEFRKHVRRIAIMKKLV